MKRCAGRHVALLLLRFTLVALACAPASSQGHLFISVGVIDRKDNPVKGLDVCDFKLFENGAEQMITRVSQKSNLLSVAIVLDTSASRRDHLAQAKQAIAEFLADMGPEDEVLVLGLNGQPGAMTNFSTDTSLAKRVLTRLTAGGPTPIFDTIFQAADMLSSRDRSRKKLS